MKGRAASADCTETSANTANAANVLNNFMTRIIRFSRRLYKRAVKCDNIAMSTPKIIPLAKDPALDDPSGINPEDARLSEVTIENAEDPVNEDLSIAPININQGENHD